MTTEFPHPHTRAFDAAAVIPPETLGALYVLVDQACREGWTFAQLRFRLMGAVGALPQADDFPVLDRMMADDRSGGMNAIGFIDQDAARGFSTGRRALAGSGSRRLDFGDKSVQRTCILEFKAFARKLRLRLELLKEKVNQTIFQRGDQ